ncbi:hypothetical protein ACLBKU_17540 [Erythrobacter sp. NE805]|uniref:hypothetical protein n=1 Tax=Erythrobacter sp. NE805 TaxID=3389875 RepID=UPI00396B13EE
MTEELASTGSRVLDEIAGVIGLKAAIDFGCAFRGERVYIPQNPAREPRIAEAIGEELAQRLCDTMWRTVVRVPMSAVLHLKVKQLDAEGQMTRREIARHLNIREGRVYEILQRARREEAQLSLF